MKILCVDDDKTLMLLLKDTLETEGFEVVTAYDGLEGVELFEKEKPDVVILDVQMPRLNGLDTCSKIRSEESGRSVPVIFLTAIDNPHFKARVRSMNAWDYILKPYNPEYLIHRIKRAC